MPQLYGCLTQICIPKKTRSKLWGNTAWSKVLSNVLLKRKFWEASPTNGCFSGVSLNGGFSQIIHFNRVYHDKSSILGNPHMWVGPQPGNSVKNVTFFWGCWVSEFMWPELKGLLVTNPRIGDFSIICNKILCLTWISQWQNGKNTNSLFNCMTQDL